MPKEQTHRIILNEQGFHQIFDEFYFPLCLFAKQYVIDDDTSADIVEETFIKLWQLRRNFLYLHQIKSFLYTAVRNKSLNELEHLQTVNEYSRQFIEKQSEAYFHDAVIEKESYRILNEAIDRLPDQMKRVMKQVLEGKKNAEIAKTLQVSPETIHTLKKLALKKLRESLKDYYYLLFFLI